MSVVTTILDFGLFNLLLALRVRPVFVAATVSYAVGMIASFLLNSHLTFRGGRPRGRYIEFSRFAVVNLLGLALHNGGVAVVNVVAGEHLLLLNTAKLVSGAGTWLMKFIVFRRWVFDLRDEGAARVVA